MKKGIIILGSSNSFGNTHKIVSYIAEKTNYPIIDLKTKHIAEFDYNFNNKDDDFLPIIRDIADNYNLIIFATPVYWYAMSGILKTFFDRISDCLKIEKDTGRKLRGKNMAVISCGSDDILKAGFHMPFIESAKYLGMTYTSDVHSWIENENIPETVKQKLDNFVTTIL
ncbi:flavodoxin family protein [Formosa sp. S-31]|uniref:flavodoxin family protein n=1 Tax=Formosa sp. S-31 TaxID=2790949 RepID=UPI003EBE7F41